MPARRGYRLAVALDLVEEIKEVGQSSFEATQRAAQSVPEKPSEEALSFFRDIILDVRANTLAFYKVAVLQARRADTAEEVTAIWKEVLFFCDGMLAGWQHLRGFEPVTQSLIDDYRKQLERLKAVALEHFQFHNGLE
jgi:hypothetical protein